ncbi:radical SAM protein [Desulfosarcina ovata subsp. sediminis]|uniref:Radical SAM protein n=1 Tax=Desulfosarcina ovata subsp. sediminis TaxID=885957 RepID=A0A5K8A213_9BACT|nr:radical SAM protein [Desulfosarcina ovata]BBO86481.1 radical SAM protein [Desulfosarcina ovata subsp. sediminis]
MKPLNCTICERRCHLTEGRPGACGLYEWKHGSIVERYADHFLVTCPISIETMPILHFQPGSKFLQVTTTGCNFSCPGCISSVLVKEMSPDSPALRHLSAEEIVDQAIRADCQGIVFLMNDPLAAFLRFLRIAELAQAKGLKVGCSSNAYFTPESLTQLMPFLDFINIGMKGFSDAAYQACGVPAIRPVLRNLKALHGAGVHIEISCILTRNNAAELFDLARHVARLSPHIPLQVMRFLPFEGAAIELEPSIRDAEDFCLTLRRMLDFVYLFNTPGSDYLNTRCPHCGKVVLEREFYGPMGAKLKLPAEGVSIDNSCPACPGYLPIVGPSATATYQEGDFEGGYPLTRAMEIVAAMLIAMGVHKKAVVVNAWEEILQDGGLKDLHRRIQHPRTYIDLLLDFGRKAGVSERAEALAMYLENQLVRVENALASPKHRPRVYYAMGKPLFYINGERLENQLVEAAGGISLNKMLPPGGRPGRNLPLAQLNALDPEIIFISAFLSNRVDDFLDECLALGVTAKAVKNRRIFVHPAPGWDFGSPRWVLGLLHMAKVFHPTRCHYNVMAEAQIFYRGFYGIDFSPQHINRSFSKPADNWRWTETAPVPTAIPPEPGPEPDRRQMLCC